MNQILPTGIAKFVCFYECGSWGSILHLCWVAFPDICQKWECLGRLGTLQVASSFPFRSGLGAMESSGSHLVSRQFCETGDSPDVTTQVQRLVWLKLQDVVSAFVSLKSSTFRSSLSSQFFIAKNFIEFPKVAALGLNGSKRIAKAKCLSRGTSSFHSFSVYHQRIQLNTSEVSLLQVEGIGRNIVPVFYAVTRPASINFLIFLAIVVCLSWFQSKNHIQ